MPKGVDVAMPMVAQPELDRREAARWKWSNTALDRLADLPFTEREVLTAVLHPYRVEPGLTRTTRKHIRGSVIAVVDTSTQVVVTILDGYAGVRGRPVRRVYVPPLPQPPAPSATNRGAPAEGALRLVEADESTVVDPRATKNMAERVRLLNAERSGTVPAIAQGWVSGICVPRLRDYPGRWARILQAPTPYAAAAWDAQVRESCSFLETAVRGVNVYARCVE